MRPLDKTPTRMITLVRAYDSARSELIAVVGSYCAYCEAPVSSDIAVEHKVPKSWFPDGEKWWTNLLPACVSCNLAKGATPRGAGAARDRSRYFASLAMQLWPDSVPTIRDQGLDYDQDALTGADTLAAFRYVLDARSQVGLVADGLLPALAAADRTAAWATTTYLRVWVVPGTTPGTADHRRAQRTIAGLKLNRFNFIDRKNNDRRVDNRTHAWRAAERLSGEFTKELERHSYKDADDLIQDKGLTLLLDVGRAAVRSMGFWSVWLTVLKLEVAKPAWADHRFAARALVEQMLLTDANGRLVIPGTDFHRVMAHLPPL